MILLKRRKTCLAQRKRPVAAAVQGDVMDVLVPAQMVDAQMVPALMDALMAGTHRAVIVRVIALIIVPIIRMAAPKGPLAVSAQRLASAAIITPQPFANAMPVAAQDAANRAVVVQDGAAQDGAALDVTIQNGDLIIVHRAGVIIEAASHLAMPRAAIAVMANNALHVRMVKASAAASPVVNQAAIAISNRAQAASLMEIMAVKLAAKTSKSAAPAAR
jgi:hypothetical protein